MAKKENKPGTGRGTLQSTAANALPKVKKGAVSDVVTPPKWLSDDLKWNMASLAGILVFVFLALKACLENQFTNWDDPGYVVNQPIIKSLSADGLQQIFSEPVMGNYHPITMLTYAIDYSLSGLAPYSFHLQSLLFHLLTTLLVFVFIYLLTGKRIWAGITALLFGLHPMHVESVAWVAGRKDVVYGCFYFLSCIAYLLYVRNKSGKKTAWYLASIILFVLSLLSKPVAVILPITLLLVDLYENRLWTDRRNFSSSFFRRKDAELPYFNVGIVFNKIPYLLFSVAAGIKSLYDQKVFGALNSQPDHFAFFERIALGGYALFTYLWKAVVPVKLVCFYPYPLKELNGNLSPIYYIYPLIALSLVGWVLYFFRRNKYVLFGVLFFLINIALLLQFIPVGGAIIADRYSYIPYIGLFFILGWAVNNVWEKSTGGQSGKMVLGGFVAYAVVLGYLSNERCKVWYDGMSLWRNEIEVEPVRAPNGYNNLGYFYFLKFNGALDPKERKLYYDSSLYLLTKAIELQKSFPNPYITIGELHRSSAIYDQGMRNFATIDQHVFEAKKYYYEALKLDSGEQAANAYIGLAILYSVTQKNDSARFCFNQTLRLKPYNPEAHSNYANFLDMNNKHEEALVEYGIAVQQNPDIVAPYLNRARAYQRMNRCDEAFRDFDKALSISPDMGEIYYARSQCYANKGNKGAALRDIEKAISLGFNQIDNNYYQAMKR